MNVIVLYLTSAGKNIGERLVSISNDQNEIATVELVGPEDWQQLGCDSLRQVVNKLFFAGKGLVFVMATGIVVRLIGPLARGKEVDPPVLSIDEGGNFVIPLLSGHLGGANNLTRVLADYLEATPVVTTASDVKGFVAFDQLAKDRNWQLEPIKSIKYANGALVKGESLDIYVDQELNVGDFEKIAKESKWPKTVSIKAFSTNQLNLGSKPCVVVTHRQIEVTGDKVLFLIPPVLSIGIGCRRGTTAKDLDSTVKDVFLRNSLSLKAIQTLGSVEVKQDEEGLLQWASSQKLEPIFIATEDINKEVEGSPEKYSISNFVKEKIGVGGVCEPVAILNSQHGQLVVPKQSLNGITVAVALAKSL